MELLKRVFDDHPAPASDAGRQALALVHSAAECAAACTACADACLSEEEVTRMRGCVRSCLDCADLCTVTGRLVSRPGEQDADTLRALLAACATACRACAEVCARHDDMEHCAACAESCRGCAEACEAMRAAIVG
ncbi:MAG TPA: hypothetical protein VK858_17555 [Longimicrobiales bacterium]|nr:hypothetical protein [Longimicrobiales bacterium]